MLLEDALSLLPRRKQASHKGQNGRVIIVGGSRGYYGAPIIAGLAAEKTGIDAVTIFLPPSHIEAAKGYSLNFFLKPMMLDEIGLYDVRAIHEAIESADVLLIGNGLGKGFDVKKVILSILAGIDESKKVVIDAQAILPEVLALYKAEKHSWIFTPHKGELSRLAGRDNLHEILPEEQVLDELINYSITQKLMVCLKGPIDRVIDGKNNKIYENRTGTPYMSVGGTGDALAGIIAAYLSLGLNPIDAMRLAVFLWGLCGEKINRQLTAYEMLTIWPDFIKDNLSKTTLF